MKIIGLDPSISNWGIAKGTLSEDNVLKITDISTLSLKGLLNPKVKKSLNNMRLSNLLYTQLKEDLKDADIVCVEVPHGCKSATAACNLYMVHAILGILDKDKDFVLVTPFDIKKVVGKETKRDIIEWAYARHPEAPWLMRNGLPQLNVSEHQADAIAAIYAASNKLAFKIKHRNFYNAN